MKCEENFMIRVPYHSFDYYKDYLENKEKCTLNDFKENLLVSSSALYNAINSKDELNADENESLFKYMIRSSTRCTPYGLASGVLTGTFDKKNELIINDCFVKKVRPDMSWMIKVIKKLEIELGTELKVVANNMSNVTGNKIIKRWNSCYISDQNLQEHTISINNTSAVKYVLDICKEYVSIKEIIFKLKEISSNVNDEAIINFINSLLDNEFLTSDLRPNTLITDPLDYILKKIDEYKFDIPMKNKLCKLYRMLKDYEKCEIGNGEDRYISIVTFMKNICESENYLQVDMYNNSKLKLSETVKKDINDFADFLSKYSYNETFYDYAVRFKEKYGNQAVKFLDLIDEEKGLGIPESDNKNSLKYNDQIICKIISILSENKDKNIELEKYLNEKDSLIHDNVAHTDGELAFYLYRDNNEMKYMISPLMGSNTEYKISGRFEYLFPDMHLPNINNNFKEVEVCFLPQDARHGNVMMCQSNKKAFLEYGTNILIEDKERVDINDVYVIVDNQNYIRFVQKSTNEIIEFYASNMFNINAYPKEIKILLEITNKQKLIFTGFYTALQHYILQIKGYLPRISYKNVILFPASFSVMKDINYRNKEQALKDIYKYIKEMQEKNDFSELISVGPLDQRMLLNINNKIHLNILYNMLKADNRLRIYENIFDESNLSISNNYNNSFIGEMVISLSHKQNNFNNYLLLPNNVQYLDTEKYLKYSKMPFENWISVKLYANEELHNIILTNYISKINNILKKELDHAEMFFIRYKDPKSHIRLRIKYQEDELSKVIELISKVIHELKKNKLIIDCVIDTYFQEFERYGGDAVYNNAEKLFALDSELAIEFIKLRKYNLTELKMTDLFILSTYKLLEELQMTSEEKLYYLENYNIGKKYNNEFKQINSRLKTYINNNNLWENLRSTEEGIRLLICLDKFEKDFIQFWQKADSHFKNNNERKKGILLSLFHMQFNRMIGINRNLENKTMGYLRKFIYNQAMREKYYGKE